MNDGPKESFASDGDDKLSRQPAYYLRASSPLNLATALLLLGSFISVLTLVWVITNGIQEASRISIQNERNERINQDNKIEQRLDGCCKGRGW